MCVKKLMPLRLWNHLSFLVINICIIIICDIPTYANILWYYGDFFFLFSGSYRIKDKFISRFESMNTVQSYAKMVDDMELQSRMKIVFQYHSRIPMLVQKIKKSSVRFDGGILKIYLVLSSFGICCQMCNLPSSFSTRRPCLQKKKPRTCMC